MDALRGQFVLLDPLSRAHLEPALVLFFFLFGELRPQKISQGSEPLAGGHLALAAKLAEEEEEQD